MSLERKQEKTNKKRKGKEEKVKVGGKAVLEKTEVEKLNTTRENKIIRESRRRDSICMKSMKESKRRDSAHKYEKRRKSKSMSQCKRGECIQLRKKADEKKVKV
jgi:hypothetical protein